MGYDTRHGCPDFVFPTVPFYVARERLFAPTPPTFAGAVIFPPVEIGYLNYSEPSFADAANRCANAGATRIIVAPYFLISGFFITKSLPEKIVEAQAVHPGVEFVVAEAFNYHETLADAVWESALGAKASHGWRDPLKAAAAACRPFPECPLYGTSACPKAPVAPTPGTL